MGSTDQAKDVQEPCCLRFLSIYNKDTVTNKN